MKKLITQFFIWMRLVVSPTVVVAAYQATRDGVITSKELGAIITQMNFELKIPFVKHTKT